MIVKLLKKINIEKADIFLAVTESQNTNFTLAVIAKKLGAKKTIARTYEDMVFRNLILLYKVGYFFTGLIFKKLRIKVGIHDPIASNNGQCCTKHNLVDALFAK